MASKLGACSRATPVSSHFRKITNPLLSPLRQSVLTDNLRRRIIGSSRIRVSNNDGDSYLDMWKNAVDRDKKTVEFQRISEKMAGNDANNDGGQRVDLEKKTEDFEKILDVSKEERDRIQRMQVIDRAAAAIAAARAILKEKRSEKNEANPGDNANLDRQSGGEGGKDITQGGKSNGSIFVTQSETSGKGVPGPDFWSWTPPPDSDRKLEDPDLLEAKRALIYPILASPVAMKERCLDFLDIPLESKLSEASSNPPIPPLQSLMEVKKEEVSLSNLEMPSLKEEEHQLNLLFSARAAEAAHVLGTDEVDEPFSGIDPDGSRWWKETGIDRRPDGVICRWTMTRAVSADQDVEWQEKFWEAADEFGYRELGSEKSGRDVTGNVWREYWRESMWQESGLVHLEKTANKWGKNGKGDEWQEEWWEHYDASNQAEKWAHKWCTIDPTTSLDVGHAHVWHERWGEKYDGHGGTMKYTDKWAERCEGDSWTKWGDKWDEHFDPNGHGVKQGETWWEGKHGEKWNRTWGERHNGSGWVHKYGRSSSGEHWDTHVQQETWYEKFPHFGFYHCFDNSLQLREVQNLQIPADSLES